MTGAGPIHYLVLEFPGARWRGAPLQVVLDLVDAGVIRVLDLRIVTRHDDGSYEVVTLGDLEGDGTLDPALFDGVESGLLTPDDVGEAARVVEPGSVGGLLVYEDLWAAPLVDAADRTGARLVASGVVSAADVVAALDRLEAAG